MPLANDRVKLALGALPIRDQDGVADDHLRLQLICGSEDVNPSLSSRDLWGRSFVHLTLHSAVGGISRRSAPGATRQRESLGVRSAAQAEGQADASTILSTTTPLESCIADWECSLLLWRILNRTNSVFELLPIDPEEPARTRPRPAKIVHDQFDHALHIPGVLNLSSCRQRQGLRGFLTKDYRPPPGGRGTSGSWRAGQCGCCPSQKPRRAKKGRRRTQQPH
jgi:hypothetical protein